MKWVSHAASLCVCRCHSPSSRELKTLLRNRTRSVCVSLSLSLDGGVSWCLICAWSSCTLGLCVATLEISTVERVWGLIGWFNPPSRSVASDTDKQSSVSMWPTNTRTHCKHYRIQCIFIVCRAMTNEVKKMVWWCKWRTKHYLTPFSDK